MRGVPPVPEPRRSLRRRNGPAVLGVLALVTVLLLPGGAVGGGSPSASSPVRTPQGSAGNPASAATTGTLVLANGTYLPSDYDASWANQADPSALGWDPVSDEVWIAGGQQFSGNLGSGAPISIYNATAGAVSGPILLGGGSLTSPVVVSGFAYDANPAQMDVVDEGAAMLRVWNASSHPDHTSVRNIPLGGIPGSAAVDGATGLVWVTNDIGSGGVIDVVNTSSGSVTTLPDANAMSVVYDPPADVMVVGTLFNLTLFNATSDAVVAHVPLPGYALAIDPTTGRIYAVAETGNVSVIAAPAGTFLGNVSVGGELWDVAYDPSTSSILTIDTMSGTLSEVTPANDSVAASVRVGADPRALLVDPSNGLVVVGLSASSSIAVLPAATLASVTVVPFGGTPARLYADPGSGDLLVLDPTAGGAAIVVPTPIPSRPGFLSLSTNLTTYHPGTPVPAGGAWDPALGRSLLAWPTVANLIEVAGSPPRRVGTFPTPFAPEGVAYDAASGELAVVGSRSVAFLNASTGTVDANVSLSGASVRPVGLSYDGANGELYVLTGAPYLGGPGVLYALPGASHAPVRNTTVGHDPAGLAVDPVGGRIFVAEFNDGNVSVYRTSDLGLIREVVVSGPYGLGEPAGVRYSPAHDALYVTEFGGSTLDIYDATTFVSEGTYPAPTGPAGLLFNSTTGTLYVASADSDSLHLFSNLSGPLITSFTARPSTVAVGQATVLTVVASGGTPPLSYAYGTLPGCPSANTSTLTCTPSQGGTFAVTITVRDAAGLASTDGLTLTVTGAPSGPTYQVGFTVTPASCGPLTVAGVAHADGTTAVFAAGTYASSFGSCPGHGPGLPSGSGGVTLNATNLTVAGNGTASVVFLAPGIFAVEIVVAPTSCGADVSVNGTAYGPNSTVGLPAGRYPISAGLCGGHPFEQFTTTGATSVVSGALVVSGNGTVTALYGASPSVPNGPPQPISWLAVFSGVAVAVLVLVAWWALRRRSATPPEEPGDGRPPESTS